MDSDPIIYGDAPEYDHDDQPRPKRPRLSTEGPDDGAATCSSNNNNRKPFDPHSETNTIPGLFLATNCQVVPGIGLSPKNNAPDQQALNPPPAAASITEENLELDGGNEGTSSLPLVNDGEDNEKKSKVEDEHIIYGNDKTADLIAPNPDESEVEKDNIGVFRDKEDFMEKGMANMGNPEAEWQLDSSAEESDDDANEGSHNSSPSSDDGGSSTTSGSDDEDDEGEDAVFLDIQKEARRLMDEDAGSDDEASGGAKGRVSGPLKTKNELPEAKLASTRPEIDITASTPIIPLGIIDSVVDDLILVKASVSGEYQVLNERSVLCFEDRSLLGWVQETFGRVEQPFYTVRLRDSEEVKQLKATVGRKVSYIPSHSTFLFTKTIRAVKGSDASNFFDEEVGDDEREFSDDEAEAEFKKRQKEEKKARGAALRSQGQAPPLAQTATQSQAADVIDEPYVPLSRPANLHEMSAPPSQANQRLPPRDFQSNRGSRGFRGRGRGGRQAPQGRHDFKSGPRQQNQSSDHHHHHHNHNQNHNQNQPQQHQQNLQRTPNPPLPQVPLPLVPPPAFLPFFAQGCTMPPAAFPSGPHIPPAFFPIPPNPQLQIPHQLGQIPPLPLNPAQIPMLQTQPPRPPSVEDILHILRSQGHNL